MDTAFIANEERKRSVGYLETLEALVCRRRVIPSKFTQALSVHTAAPLPNANLVQVLHPLLQVLHDGDTEPIDVSVVGRGVCVVVGAGVVVWEPPLVDCPDEEFEDPVFEVGGVVVAVPLHSPL